MSNPTNATTLATIQATLIAQETMVQYERHSVFDKLVGPQHLYEVPAGVRTLSVSQQPVLAFGNPTEAVVHDSTEFTTTERTLTPVTRAANILESWEASQGTPVDTVNMYAQAAARGYIQQMETAATVSYAAHYTEADTNLGTNGVAMRASLIRQAVGQLMSDGAPAPYNYVVDPIQFNELMSDAEFRTNAVRDLTSPHGYASTVGVSLDRYLGIIYGVHVWVGNGMIEAAGLHSMMFGQGAIGRGYKNWYTDANPVPAQLHVSKEWQTNVSANRIWFRASWDIEGLVFSNTNNDWMVEIIS